MNEQDFSDIMKPLAQLCKPNAFTEKQIQFKGKAYVLIGDIESGGAIATKKQYESGECSYAYLYPDGSIKRRGKVIGTKDEIVEEKSQ